VAIRSGTSTPDLSYVIPFVLNATGWNTFVFAIPPPITGTWPIDATTGMYLSFAFMCGTTYQTPTANAWVVGNYFGHSSMSNFMSVTGGEIRIANVGLYLDPDKTGLPPQWQMPDEAEELQACQRYWQKSTGATAMIVSGISTAAGQILDESFILPVQMRANPAGVLNGITSSNSSNLIVGSAEMGAFRVRMTTSVASTCYALFGYTLSARM